MTGISARSSLRISGSRLHLGIDLPVSSYGLLAAEADRQGGGLKRIFSNLVLDLVRDPDRIRARSEMASVNGWDDHTIAEQLGLSSRQVAEWRRGIGYVPNRPGKGKGKI